jgi:biotin transporter BioY
MSTFTAIKAVGTNRIMVFFLGIVLLAISSKIAIPFYPVPMTLQTLVIYLIAGSMGILGFYSTTSYIVIGLLGAPIFAAGGGPAYIASPTFGFLYGMVISSFLIAFLLNNIFKKDIFGITLSIFIGAIMIFICGVTHLSAFIGLDKAIQAGLFPFIYSEGLKILVAICVISFLHNKKIFIRDK